MAAVIKFSQALFLRYLYDISQSIVKIDTCKAPKGKPFFNLQQNFVFNPDF